MEDNRLVLLAGGIILSLIALAGLLFVFEQTKDADIEKTIQNGIIMTQGDRYAVEPSIAGFSDDLVFKGESKDGAKLRFETSDGTDIIIKNENGMTFDAFGVDFKIAKYDANTELLKLKRLPAYED